GRTRCTRCGADSWSAIDPLACQPDPANPDTNAPRCGEEIDDPENSGDVDAFLQDLLVARGDGTYDLPRPFFLWFAPHLPRARVPPASPSLTTRCSCTSRTTATSSRAPKTASPRTATGRCCFSSTRNRRRRHAWTPTSRTPLTSCRRSSAMPAGTVRRFPPGPPAGTCGRPTPPTGCGPHPAGPRSTAAARPRATR